MSDTMDWLNADLVDDLKRQRDTLKMRLAEAEKMLAHEATFWRERVTALDKKLAEAEALLREAKVAVILHRPHALVVGYIDAFLTPDSAAAALPEMHWSAAHQTEDGLCLCKLCGQRVTIAPLDLEPVPDEAGMEMRQHE